MEHGEGNTSRVDEGFDLALVAIDDYDDPEFPSDLGCVAAAETVKAALGDLGGVVAECADTNRGSKSEVLTWLRERTRSESPGLVLYWAGHGEVHAGAADRSHMLILSGDTPSDLDLLGLRTADLMGALGGGWRDSSRWTVVVLDACGSETGAWELDKMVPINHDGPIMLVPTGLGASFSGAFAEALRSVVYRNLSDWRRGGCEVDRLFQMAAGRVNATGIKSSGNWAGVRVRGRPEVPDGLTAEAAQECYRLLGEQPDALAGHLFSAASGAEAGEMAWHFTGRHNESEEIARWLTDDTEPLMVVTGDPGSGKSALLGRTAMFSNPELAGSLIELGLIAQPDPDTVPPAHSVTATVHLRGQTALSAARQLLNQLAPNPGDTAARPGEQDADSGHSLAGAVRRLVTELDPQQEHSLEEAAHPGGGGPWVILVDALDEARDPLEVERHFFSGLLAIPGVRLLVGTRRSTLDALEQPKAHHTDLTDALREVGLQPRELDLRPDPGAMADYVRARLNAAFGPEHLADQVDETGLSDRVGELAERVGQSSQPFLFARLVVTEFIARGPGGLTDETAQQLADGTSRGVFAAALDRLRDQAVLLGNGTEVSGRMAVAMLRALAYAQGRGVPVDSWLATAGALDPELRDLLADPSKLGLGQRLVDRLVGEVAKPGLAAGYVALDSEGWPAVRLAHQTFNEHFWRETTRAGRPVEEEGGHPQPERHEVIARALAAAALDNQQLNGYTDRYLAAHLALTGRIDDLLDERPELADVGSPGLLATELFRTPGRRGVQARVVLNLAAELSPLSIHQRRQLRTAHTSAMTAHPAPADARVTPKWATGTVVRDTTRPLSGHTGSVSSVAFGAVGGRTVLATGSHDQTVRLWDPITGTPVGEPLSGHTGSVSSVAFGVVDGVTVLASGSHDQTVRLWEPSTGAIVGQSFIGHTSWVSSVAFGVVDGGTVLATGSYDQTVRLWDPITGTAVGEPLTGHTGSVNSVVFEAVGGRTVLATGSYDQTVRLWDPITGTAVGEPLTGHTGLVSSVAFGIFDGATVLVTGSSDKTVRLWDPITGTAVGEPLTGHTGSVSSVAFRIIDGTTVLVTGSYDKTVRVWDPTACTPIGRPLTGHTKGVNSVAFGIVDGGTVLATGSDDKTVRLWAPTTGTAVGEPLTGHTGSVSSVAFGTVDGATVLATGSYDQTARLWDPGTGALVGQSFLGHTSWVNSVAFGVVDGAMVLATGSYDQTVRLWAPTTGIAVGEPLTGHTNGVNSVAFGTVDGATVLATGSYDQTVRLWDPIAGTLVGEPLTGHTGWVNSVAFGVVDGVTVLATGSYDQTVRLWDPIAGTLVGEPLTGHTGSVLSVAFGIVDGAMVLATGSVDKTVRLWDPITGTPVGEPLTGHTGSVLSVAFGIVDGGTVLATGSYDKTVRLWDPIAGTLVGEPLTGHTDSVDSVAFGTVGGATVLASGSHDSLLVVWNLVGLWRTREVQYQKFGETDHPSGIVQVGP